MSDNDEEIRQALRRLAESVVVPPPDPAREQALLAVFGRRQAPRSPRSWIWQAGLGLAAALLIAFGIGPAERRLSPTSLLAPPHTAPESRAAQAGPIPGPFVLVPDAAWLPPFESGSLVRVDLPVAELPGLGIVPPAVSSGRVTADLIVGQDGLTRAVRLVN